MFFSPCDGLSDTAQLIISLGPATRTLQIASRYIRVNSGDVALFGSARHGVAPEECDLPRISIAAFFAITKAQ